MDERQRVRIDADGVPLEGVLGMPEEPRGLVVFVHGAGSSRLSPRNTFVAERLERSGTATLLFDLLTEAEDSYYPNRFDIDLLTARLRSAVDWALAHPRLGGLGLGLFGASTGAAAALRLASEMERVDAVVSRGGRPDLAGDALLRVETPTLLIVGGDDHVVLGLNRQAFRQLAAVEKELMVVPGATHLFEEPGALEEVSRLASGWFVRYLSRRGAPVSP